MPLWYDFISLVFPRVCASCGNTLLRHEACICNFCLVHLPATDFHHHSDNPASRLFWGRALVHHVASLYYFHKGSRVQHLVHLLKYKGKEEVGVFLGKHYGNELQKSPLFADVDVIIPVPLHPKKLRKRGYNQSEVFARGLSQSMQAVTDNRTLLRITATDTQTRKSRFRRWENVSEVFALHQPEHLAGKHLLLVDDVVTTGATLEACVQELLKCKDVKVSIATIACALK
jgi:ComF family protein